MAEEMGRGTAAREAILRLRLTASEGVECLVHTGFTGGPVLSQNLVARLGIPVVGREVFEMVGIRPCHPRVLAVLSSVLSTTGL